MGYSIQAIKMDFEPQRSAAFGAVVAGYTAVGTALLNPARQFKIDNFTLAAAGADSLLQFAIGSPGQPITELVDAFVLNSGQSWINDCTTNKSDESKGFYLPEGTTLYVKRIGVPASGSVYFSVIYGKSGY